MEKLELRIACRHLKGNCGNGMVVPKILNVDLPCKTSVSTSGQGNLKELKARTRTNICIPMFIAASFIIAKRCKQPTRPLTDEWTNRMWYYAYNILLFSLQNEWYNIGWTLQTKQVKKQTQKDKGIMQVWFHLHDTSYSSRARAGKGPVVAGAGGKRTWGITESRKIV